MSQPGYDVHHLAEVVHRLRARLALANFKRQHGYEKYDLSTLESNLFSTRPHRRIARRNSLSQPRRHRYYPLTAPPKKTKPFTLYLSPSFIRSPLSAKRNTPPRKRLPVTASPATSTLTLSSDDEDAANLLVMLHTMT